MDLRLPSRLGHPESCLKSPTAAFSAGVRAILIERAELTVAPGAASDFEVTMAQQGLPLLTGVPGVSWANLGAGVENPDRFLLLVHWETMASHTAFTESERFLEFRRLLKPYLVGGEMEHFTFTAWPS